MLNEWKISKQLKNKDVSADVQINGCEACISSNESGAYRTAACETMFSGLEKDYVYTFDIKAENEGMDYKINYFWIDTEGKELAGGYVDTKDEILCDFDNADLKISVRAYGREKGYVKVCLPQITVKEKYKKRKAVLAAIPISYGFVNQHTIRSFEDNLEDSLTAIDGLMGDYKADIVVLTECFYSRCINGRSYEESLLSIDSPQINALKDKAKQHKIYLTFSIKEKSSDGEIYNSAILIDRNGEIVANYHKIHLTCGELYDGMTPGNEYVVYDCDFGKIGFAICWDLFFPEHTAILRQMGAEIIINPSAGFLEERSITRAIENGVYLINAGIHPHTTMIFNPQGEKIASCAYGAAVAEVDLNEKKYTKYLSVNSQAEGRNIYFYERRPETYKMLTEKK